MHPSSRSGLVLCSFCGLAGFLLAGLAGCSSTTVPATGDIAQDLKHVDPRFRILAVRAAAEEARVDLLDLVVENLSDTDPAVRMFTCVALRKLTGQEIDFKPHGTAAEREEGLARWVKWIEGTKTHAPGENQAVGQISKQ